MCQRRTLFAVAGPVGPDIPVLEEYLAEDVDVERPAIVQHDLSLGDIGPQGGWLDQD